MMKYLQNPFSIFLDKQNDVNIGTSMGDFTNKYAPWLKILKETQEEIANIVSLPFYTNPQSGSYNSGEKYYFPPYKDAEIYYWYNIARWIYDDSKKRKISKSLDIGASYGTLSLFTKKINPDCQIHIVDFNEVYMSKNLVNKYNIKYAVNNIELDPLPWQEKFDAIIFTEVLEHLNFNPIPTLRKIVSFLEPDGKIYLSTPDALEWGRVDKYYGDYRSMPYPSKGSSIVDTHVYQYMKGELMEIFSDCGLSVERMDYAPGYGGGRHFNLVLVRTV